MCIKKNDVTIDIFREFMFSILIYCSFEDLIKMVSLIGIDALRSNEVHLPHFVFRMALVFKFRFKTSHPGIYLN